MTLRPPDEAGGFLLLLLASCLAASTARGAEGFHLFPETAGPAPAGIGLQLGGLPPAEPFAALSLPPRSKAGSDSTSLPAAASLPLHPAEQRFGAAAAELIGLELVPWFLDRYVGHESWAYISAATVKYNLQTGFTWDNDVFSGNQAAHGFHGSLYFNSARTNGFSFWEAAPYAFGGSFLWEAFSESQPPSINDLVNTTLGGMVWGEIEFRISNMILDSGASGFPRFLREAGALAVNPMGGLNRLLRGEMWKDFRNPGDRLPSRFYVELDGMYRHGGGFAPEREDTDQAGLAFLVRYGDLFDGEHRHPFEYFDLSLDFLTPHANVLTEFVVRGLLKDWKLSRNPSAEQRLGLFLGTEYFNNEQALYGSQVFAASHLMRIPFGTETDFRTEAGVLGMPVVALGVDYPGADLSSTAGRSYDYGPGFGARARATLRRRGVDLLALAWSLVGQRKSSGISKSSRIQTLSAEARLPVTANLVLGAGCSWGERLTRYDQLPTVDVSGTAWRVFAGWAIPEAPLWRVRPADLPPPPVPPAEPAGRWGVTLFSGGFFGTRVHTGSDLNVLMANAPTYGLRVGYGFSRAFSLEAGWSRAGARLEPESPETGALVAPTRPVTVNTYEIDGLFGFGGSSVRGYVGLGAGVQDIRPSVSGLDASGTTARFAANVPLGALYFVTPRLAIRVDGRYRLRASDNRRGATVCDSTGCTQYATNLFSSAEVTGGLTVRF